MRRSELPHEMRRLEPTRGTIRPEPPREIRRPKSGREFERPGNTIHQILLYIYCYLNDIYYTTTSKLIQSQ
eukprot:UN25421